MRDFGAMDTVRESRTTSAATTAAISLLLIVGFTALTAVGAVFRMPLPFTPVPVTLQTLMVLLAGAMLGGVRGSLSQVLYAAWGVSGLPLFTGAAAGLAVLAGPTGGYIIGFALAAMVVGMLIRRAHSVAAQAGVFALGTAVILASGWLHLTLTWTAGDMGAALMIGVLPFLPGAVLKIAAATGIWRAYTALRRG